MPTCLSTYLIPLLVIKLTSNFPGRWRQYVLRGLILIGVLATAHFLYTFLVADAGGHPWLYAMLVVILIYGALKNLSLWYYYLKMTQPKLPVLEKSFSVDVLTTYFPGEPYEMVEATLEAIVRMHYQHTTYLCDEANDPYLIELCERLGVIHVTRNNRINAKAGNINNALRQATGEICLILDPDHVPEPDFLDHVVPHFQEPRIGFVQVVQTYYNRKQSLVAKGAAQQTFHFYGPVMMGMNGYGTVNPIGANCTFRRAALDEIGGHAPGLAEDMHTGMLLYAKGWRSVYVPKVVARGLVPATLTAYYKQQLKWSRGTFDLLWKVYPRIFWSLTWRQRLHYALMPLHYLSGIFYFIGFMIPVLSLLWSDTPWLGNFGYFLLLAAPVITASFVIRFYVQQWLIADDERGFHIVGGILEIVTWWVFTLGFLYSLIGRKVPYLPTPKDDKDVTHPTLILPNLFVGVLSLFAIGYGLPRDFTPFSIVMAVFALANAFFMFFSVYLAIGHTNRNRLIRNSLSEGGRQLGNRALQFLLWSLDVMTVCVRKTAPLLLLTVCLASWWLLDYRQRAEFETSGLFFAEMENLAPDVLEGQAVISRPDAKDYALMVPGRIVAVDYLKATEWADSHYVLTRKSIVADFKAMKALGIDAIRIARPGIYEHNLLLLAAEHELKVIYAFQEPDEKALRRKSATLSTWKAALLETVARNREVPVVVGWEVHRAKPLLGGNRLVNEQYLPSSLEWFKELEEEIRAIDARPVSLLTSPDSITADVPYAVFANWQNEWRRERISFDGLLDFNGLKTTAYRALEINRGKDLPELTLPEISILPSAEPLFPGRQTRYSAVFAEGDQWRIPTDSPAYALEWRLIKLDSWGKPIAIRVIGNDPVLYLEVPAPYDRYELLLTVSAEGYARSVSARLNVPLKEDQEDSARSLDAVDEF